MADLKIRAYAQYSFTNGSLKDGSGNGRDLTMIGNVSFTDDNLGNPNSAVAFNGTDGRFELPISENFATPCISYITKFGYSNYERHIGINSDDSGNGFEVSTRDENGCYIGPRVKINGMRYNCESYFKTMEDNNFHHILARYTGSTLEIYIDKILHGKMDVTGEIEYSTIKKIFINMGGSTDDVIDEVYVYNEVLTGGVANVGETATGEIAELYDLSMFDIITGGEVTMNEREIMLGLGSIKVKKAGDTEYTEIGDTKSEAKLAIEEKYADVKTVESGTIKKVLESTTVTLEATISQLSKELLAKLTNMTNTAGVLSGGGGIGTVAPEFELIFHPLDEAGTDWDVKFFRCTLETKLEKNAKPGEQAGLNIKAEALYDREAGKKFQIG